MPAPSASFKKALQQLSEKEKETLILRAARRDAELYEMLAYELVEDITLESVFEQADTTIRSLMLDTKGRYLGRALSKSLRKAVKEIARFKRITKSEKGEIDLHLQLLQLLFDRYTEHFDGHYKSFYTATARLATRTRQLIRKNLHEDYWVEYREPVNGFLDRLHHHSKSQNLSFALPRSLED